MDITGLGLNPLPRKPGCTGTMSKEELLWMMHQAERRVPAEVRAHKRLQELHASFGNFAEPPNNRFRSIDEWKEFRKLMRHGKRIATRFGDARYKEIFGVMYATATTFLAGGGHL